MTFYYTIDPDIFKRENLVNIYKIEDNYPYYQNTLFVSFDESVQDSVNDYLIGEGVINFEISRL